MERKLLGQIRTARGLSRLLLPVFVLGIGLAIPSVAEANAQCSSSHTHPAASGVVHVDYVVGSRYLGSSFVSDNSGNYQGSGGVWGYHGEGYAYC